MLFKKILRLLKYHPQTIQELNTKIRIDKWRLEKVIRKMLWSGLITKHNDKLIISEKGIFLLKGEGFDGSFKPSSLYNTLSELFVEDNIIFLNKIYPASVLGTNFFSTIRNYSLLGFLTFKKWRGKKRSKVFYEFTLTKQGLNFLMDYDEKLRYSDIII